MVKDYLIEEDFIVWGSLTSRPGPIQLFKSINPNTYAIYELLDHVVVSNATATNEFAMKRWEGWRTRAALTQLERG